MKKIHDFRETVQEVKESVQGIKETVQEGIETQTGHLVAKSKKGIFHILFGTYSTATRTRE